MFPSHDLASMDVNGRFVFVGVTAPGVMPQLATPVGLLEPHKIQAALSESMLIQDSPIIPDYSLLAELMILLVTTVLVWFLLFYFGINLGLFFSAVILGMTAFFGYYLIQKGLLIDVSWTLINQLRIVTGKQA